MIIIQQKYIPTQAGVRRIQALARGLAQYDEPITIVYLSSENSKTIEDTIPGVKFETWGRRMTKLNQKLGLIASILHLLFALPKDKIYYYGMNPFIMFILMLHKRTFYHEFTEYPPFIYGSGIFGDISKFIHICFMKRCAHTFVISKRLKQYCASKGINNDRLTLLNMFVDANRFDGLKNDNKQRYIAYCGNGENFKDGVDILIRAFSIVTCKIPDVNLYILGKGPIKDVEIQNDIIKKHNLQNRVKMLGVVKSEEIPQYLVSAEILALARPDNIQASFGFPTKVGEYLSTGNPVVLTRVGELEDFLSDGIDAIFAEPDNYKDFADKLLWTLEHQNEAKLIGANGKKVAENHFNNLLEAKKVVNVIRK